MLLYLLFLILPLIALPLVMRAVAGTQSGQQAAKRFSSDGTRFSQISVFFTEKAKVIPESILVLRGKINETMTAQDQTSEAGTQQPYIDCYSATGSLTVSTDRATGSFRACGVGGHFFFFHPLTLQSGSYISDDSMMDDAIVLDEDCAWQLFGSTDVAGMQVFAGQTPLVVAGVVARENTLFSEAAGNTKPTIYMPYPTLKRLGSVSSISCYEIVLPRLTGSYATQLVRDQLDVGKSKREIVENTTRYRPSHLMDVLGSYGKRSMQTKPLVYPYWENQARATEDVCALLWVLFLIDALCLTCLLVRTGYFLFKQLSTRLHRDKHPIG